MKEFRQVFRMGRGFVFRLALPNCRFVSTEICDTAEDAAFRADLFKRYVTLMYSLTGATLVPSLSPVRFRELMGEAGINPESASDILIALPASCRDYLENGGHETLTAYAKAQDEIKAGSK